MTSDLSLLGISDTAIVDRGRNVVSCSRDGSARLWDCGKAACLRTVADCEAEINACSLVTPNTAVQLGSHQTKLSMGLHYLFVFIQNSSN